MQGQASMKKVFGLPSNCLMTVLIFIFKTLFIKLLIRYNVKCLKHQFCKNTLEFILRKCNDINIANKITFNCYIKLKKHCLMHTVEICFTLHTGY